MTYRERGADLEIIDIRHGGHAEGRPSRQLRRPNRNSPDLLVPGHCKVAISEEFRANPTALQQCPALLCINQGRTTSMFYRDPDDNQVELQLDKFDTGGHGKGAFAIACRREEPDRASSSILTRPQSWLSIDN